MQTGVDEFDAGLMMNKRNPRAGYVLSRGSRSRELQLAEEKMLNECPRTELRLGKAGIERLKVRFRWYSAGAWAHTALKLARSGTAA